MERRPPGKRIAELSSMDLKSLYSMFLNLAVFWPGAVGDLGSLLNKTSMQRLGVPLVVDEMTLAQLPDTPEELVNKLAQAVASHLRRKLSETVTEARLMHVSEEVVSEIIRDAIKTLLVMYGYW